MMDQLSNPLFIVAFGIAPLMVLGWAGVLVWLHQRSIRNGSIDH